MAGNMADEEKLKHVEQFMSITGAGKDTAISMLEACSGNIQLAVDMYLESNDGPSPVSHSKARKTNMKQSDFESRRHCRHWHSQAEKSRDSSTMGRASSGKKNERHSAECASENALNNDDDVRAPIPQTRGILAEDPYHAIPYARTRSKAGGKSVFDAFRDFQAEANAQEEALNNGPSCSTKSKVKTLHDLFRPPVDITFKGTFEAARSAGDQQRRWLLVNIQNNREFACQALNRDVWSNPLVRELLKEYFLLWQIYHDSDEGQRYMLYYQVKDYPYLSVIDPRTGECLTVWENMGRIDAQLFCDLATQFLAEHPDFSINESNEPPSKRAKKDSIIDATEDSQLAAAIAASLNEEEKVVSSGDDDDVDSEDDDIEDNIEPFDDSDEELLPTTSCDEKFRDRLSVDKKSVDTDAHSKQSHKQAEQKNDTQKLCANKKDTDKVKSNNDIDKVSRICKKDKEENLNNVANWKSLIAEEGDTGFLEGETGKLMLRLPKGCRKQVRVKAVLTLKDISEYIASLGYSRNRYELVTNFPRRNLSELNEDTTLQSAGLYPQETIFVQER